MQAGKVDHVAPGIRRILAPNPSAMTGPGTNSYLIGRRALMLVDPGPLSGAHQAALLAAVAPGERITAILVTHAHLDHCAGAPALSAATGARVMAFGDATCGRSEVMKRLAASGLTGGGEGVDTTFRPDTLVADGAQITVGEVTIQVIHTPGHMGGHICLGVGDVLLSGDHAMGWASSLISPPDGDMGAYMTSLARLSAARWSLMLPGHGEAVTDAATRLRALHDHRKAREAAVLSALAHAPATAATLAAQIYHDTPAALMPAAARNVLAHLIDLTTRNLVITPDQPGPSAIFHRPPPSP